MASGSSSGGSAGDGRVSPRLELERLMTTLEVARTNLALQREGTQLLRLLDAALQQQSHQERINQKEREMNVLYEEIVGLQQQIYTLKEEIHQQQIDELTNQMTLLRQEIQRQNRRIRLMLRERRHSRRPKEFMEPSDAA